mgnify:CR=1 FL=1
MGVSANSHGKIILCPWMNKHLRKLSKINRIQAATYQAVSGSGSMAVSELHDQTVSIINNDEITIYGDGSQTRSFSYVEDTVDGIIALMKSDKFDVFNIGNPNEMTIKELSSVILKLTGSKSKLIYKELPNDDPKQRRPDIKKAKENLDWEPKVDLETGLTLTIDWIKKELAI